jgi:hypothetical protein
MVSPGSRVPCRRRAGYGYAPGETGYWYDQKSLPIKFQVSRLYAGVSASHSGIDDFPRDQKLRVLYISCCCRGYSTLQVVHKSVSSRWPQASQDLLLGMTVVCFTKALEQIHIKVWQRKL